jgi:hypothetical protein
LAGEGGKKSDPTVPIIIGIVVLLLIVLFGGCNGINLPVYNRGGNYNGSHGSQYSGGCDHYHHGDCRGGGGEEDDGDSRHDRRHHPRATETPDSDNR